ncbi:phosphotransferase [Caldalkalibacillus mannanilyticus]|uniref:phosphotransferase n=1 Tax=Caldalkalibacillus mannanilyticus TaxID=1418 RepID=UPI0004689834|nr:phosphotransferase [Caldalkalibacillus mannanilyticus]
MNNNVQNILNELHIREILHSNRLKVKRMSGTTDGCVYVLSDDQNTYVLKQDHHEQLSCVAQFLRTYHDIDILPDVLFFDSERSYLVYSYMKGTTHGHRGLKKSWLVNLVRELLNQYVVYDQNDFWGGLESPQKSWHEFNITNVDEKRSSVEGILLDSDYHLVRKLIDKLFSHTGKQDRYFLHGDNGVHNFVFDQNALVGVIDPFPMVGPVIYDFIYAFCSSSDDLNMETLLEGYKFLRHNQIDQTRLIEEVVVQLYCRIAICTKNHPDDLPEYLLAWNYWKELLQSTH